MGRCSNKQVKCSMTLTDDDVRYIHALAEAA